MNSVIEKKLLELPASPGIYFYKDKKDEIIYIGKAASLKNRVRQYFQKSRQRDAKTDALISEIADLDWTLVETELDALFLEAEMVRRYMPRYNILLRDDKSSSYVRISYDSKHPTLTMTRQPLDDGAKYFGPYFNGAEVKKALHYLRRIFPYSTHISNIPKRVCLQYHLGLCPGLEENKTTINDYRANLRKIMQYLKGERATLIKELERDMKRASRKKDFESAAQLRDQLYNLRALSKQIIFSDKEFTDLSKDRALNMLSDLLGLKNVPRRIEGYDISHLQGTDNVASMVVFSNGIPDKAAYRKFKMRLPGNDDFGHMEEAISRRLSGKNIKDWDLPDLFLIDGGKGQLGAAIKARDRLGINRPMIALAKREEEIVVQKGKSQVDLSVSDLKEQRAIYKESDDFIMLYLTPRSDIVKLLQRVRDESHRFAVSYHSVLKLKRQKSSVLDEIPGIGPLTRRKLLKEFGGQKAIAGTSLEKLSDVVGKSRAKAILQHLK
ncbi:MAG TPA: excinuclease ABC subunit UvrC [Candidatus Saccharimonadales bacterium]|nr:excinuclease ABC subunit UvrC [Candidatus Saccharimonadales bacterium]